MIIAILENTAFKLADLAVYISFSQSGARIYCDYHNMNNLLFAKCQNQNLDVKINLQGILINISRTLHKRSNKFYDTILKYVTVIT